MTLYAKSDGTTLADHTAHVADAVKTIARETIRDLTVDQWQAAIHGAVLHDLGKGHPYFQAQLAPGFDKRRYQFDVPHRHEISSILFLPLCPVVEWPQLIDMVIAHHKSLRASDGQRGRGLVDLLDEYGDDDVFQRHAEDWETWQLDVLKVLPRFDVPCRKLTREEARGAFDATVNQCEQKRVGRNVWRGLLMAADHLASALHEEIYPRLDRLFKLPDLTTFHDRAVDASGELYPLAKVASDSPKPHTLVVAPTGAGKTDFLLRRCGPRRVFYLLPFQASINAMFLRFERMLNGVDDERSAEHERTDIRRVHAAAQIEIDDGIEEEMLLQRHPGAAIKVMTPHQIAALIFGLAGHEAVALDVARQDVILDEVHVYSEQAQAMVLELVKSLIRLDCRVHIGSATIPSALAAELRECLGGEESIDEVRLDDSHLATYDRHIVHRLSDEATARERVTRWVQDGQRILFISNRVADAQARYKWVKETFPDISALLVHSRFRRGDRANIERQIDVFDKTAGPCIVCATQVIEVSLDISFDAMVTDCAPLDSLVQRFGRVNRRRVSLAEQTLRPVAVLAPPSGELASKPYSLEALQRTWQVLPDGATLHETNIQELIDHVYPTVDISEIDVHLIEPHKGFILPELWNVPRSLLLEALEIDSASVVADGDMQAYRAARGDERQKLEIPVPMKVLRPKFKVWPQIEEGHRPFVCPDVCYDSTLGLLLGEESEPKCIIL